MLSAGFHGAGVIPLLQQVSGAGGARNDFLTNLLGFWKMDEASGSALDSHTNALTLVTPGSVLADTGLVYPAARLFSGASNSIFQRVDDTFVSLNDTNWTIAVWVYPTSLAAVASLVSKRAGTLEYFLRYDSASTRFQLFVSHNNSTLVSVSANTFGAPSINNWYFVACRYDGTKIYISINGGAEDSTAHTLGVFDGGSVFYFGARQNGVEQLTGRMGPISMWKRALAASEIIALYNLGTGMRYDHYNGTLPLSLGNLSAVADDGWAGTQRINSSIYRYDAITSIVIGATTYQAICYWNTGGYLVLGKRVQGGYWTLYVYDGSGGRPTIGPATDDEHNVPCIGIDVDGYLHVAYNHHSIPLNYRQSDAPLNTWLGGLTSALSMLGTNEDIVTYPTFVKSPTGILYFLFRNGGSGDGNLYFYVYDENTGVWSAAAGTSTGGLLIEAAPDDISPYWEAPRFDADFGSGGYMHLTWCWRDTFVATTNHDINHVRWNGTNWTTIGGSAQTIPITLANAAVAVSIALGAGLSNQNGMDVDANGHPHLAYYKNDASSKAQVWHSYHNGTNWVTAQLTATLKAQSWPSDPYETSRCHVLADHASGRVYIIYRDEADPDSRTGLLVLVSGANDYTTWSKSVLLYNNVGKYEPNSDYGYWRTHGVMQLCVAPWSSGGIAWPIELLEWTPAAP